LAKAQETRAEVFRRLIQSQRVRSVSGVFFPFHSSFFIDWRRAENFFLRQEGRRNKEEERIQAVILPTARRVFI
jgi:hypothetical protein